MRKAKLSYSQMSMFSECPAKYRFKYVLGRVPITGNDHFAFGTAWDEATGIYLQEGRGAALAYVKDRAFSTNVDEVSFIKLAVLISNYRGIGDYTLVSNQAQKVVKIGRRLVMAKADSIVKDKDGRLFVREAKTSSQQIDGDSDYWQALNVNLQIAIYRLAFDAVGVLYDVVRKPMIRPSGEDLASVAEKRLGDSLTDVSAKKRKEAIAEAKKLVSTKDQLDAYTARMNAAVSESPNIWFQVREVHKTEAQLNNDVDTVSDLVKIFSYCSKRAIYPRHDFSCVSKYGNCEYLGVCTNKTDLFDNTAYEDVSWIKPF